jgi:putative PIN family toxin of toxin-antitoxin system
MIRVVIDTNILVSALLHPDGLQAAVLMLALSREVQLCVSDAIFAEYEEVIRPPRFKRSADVIEGTLRSIRKLGHWFTPSVRVQERTDPDDNMFLEYARLRRGLRRHWQSATFS